MIRKATKDDVEELVALGRSMHSESVNHVLTYSVAKVTKEILWLVDNGVFFVEHRDGKIVGLITGYVRAPYFSEDLVGYESIFFIHPDYRHGLVASKLIATWAKWCKENGAVQLKPATSCGVKGAERLYKAMGFRPVGQTFVKDLV